MDDGSDPPLKEKFPESGIVQVYPTGYTTPWTQACAKNLGARIAEGEYLLMTDIDHILSEEIIKDVYNFTGDKMVFNREYGVLNSRGVIVQALDELQRYGFDEKHYQKKGFKTYKHTNTFAMKREVFFKIGGYQELDCNGGEHPTHDDVHLLNRYKRCVRHGKCEPQVLGGITYVFPTKNKRLFHGLDRKSITDYEVKSTRFSLDHLSYMMTTNKRVFYSRFGDGEFRLMYMENDSMHRASEELKKELLDSFLIKDEKYLKSAVLGFKKEPGMRGRVFLEGKRRVKGMQKFARRISDERIFYNPVVFHYLAIYDSELLKAFINTHIIHKKIMFIGGNCQESMEQLYGPIKYYVQTPKRDAYYTIDEWWPQVLENIDNVDLVLPSVGCASAVVAKRLWKLKADVHLVDIGSINDVLEDNDSRGWIRKTGLEKIKSNLLGSNK